MNLKFLFGPFNLIEEIPEGICDIKALEIIHFNNCNIKQIPKITTKKCKFVHFANNNIEDIDIDNLKALELRKLQLEGNPCFKERKVEINEMLKQIEERVGIVIE